MGGGRIDAGLNHNAPPSGRGGTVNRGNRKNLKSSRVWQKEYWTSNQHTNIVASLHLCELPLDPVLFNLQSECPVHYQDFCKDQMKVFSIYGNNVSVWNIPEAASWACVDTREMSAGHMSWIEPGFKSFRYSARSQVLGQQGSRTH